MKDGRLQASDFMIGDWVMVNDIEHTHPLQVAEIFKKCGAYYTTLYWDGMPDNVNPETLAADVDKVFPIPLTPEILEKNGFEWTTRKSHMVSCIGTVRMIWGFYKVCLSISDNSNDGECQISSLKCKFVHELQHALRLCGIEKEIEL